MANAARCSVVNNAKSNPKVVEILTREQRIAGAQLKAMFQDIFNEAKEYQFPSRKNGSLDFPRVSNGEVNASAVCCLALCCRVFLSGKEGHCLRALGGSRMSLKD
ncbi:hypothetical protein GO013_11430 [Pseudodesulfovibrio sp. JC047]|uniref:hypothetical protein n=1 Tax=Pseudodesulfovibrio sp. JC047 TaxID=2683199 RepID=UPI0013D1449E|nr:hypothetical protein [Pseudodesulfovibrio sp. JC047]NDV20033.1 hypothetical protein [Pseudodesulfovibrio sp. JC047]